MHVCTMLQCICVHMMHACVHMYNVYVCTHDACDVHACGKMDPQYYLLMVKVTVSEVTIISALFETIA